ncbi:hypothetical protein PLEOSDRAFT_31975 [Pleurotus ostreatus PC15]|uniref:Uncharacterized protein n=1 Tax=Pleurotus ostreatus (strain PC15) TaxID=1137138 RepID=A0A067NGA7_PLEO1|nr:hypothetical protein PLEOSDRAFT_31975 [Pleurotus ostreatus PC15]
MQNDEHALLLTYLDIAMIPDTGETAIDDFAVELFKTRGAQSWRIRIRVRICAHTAEAKTDVCIVDRSINNILLLVQADKRLMNLEPVNVQAQLVAEAVAAYNENNAQRRVAGLTSLDQKVSHFASLWSRGTLSDF